MRILTLMLTLTLSLPAMAAGTEGPPEVTVDGLERMDSENVDLLYVLPGTDLSAYDRIFLLAPDVRFVKDYKRKANQLYDFRVTDADMQKMREDLARLFAEEFFDELQTEGGYELVTSLGEGVLVIRPALVDVDVLAPAAMGRPNSRSSMPSAGRMTLLLEMADGVTNTSLVKVLDYQYDRTMVKPYTNAERNEQAARQILSHWATLLRKALDEAHNKASADGS